MDTDSVRKHKLLQQVKRGKMGVTQWTRLFVILVAAAEMFNVVWDVHQGKGSVILLADAIVMIFILAIAGIGLGALEMNERLAALIQLIGEDKLLHGKE
jgi:membrane protein YdbS with pleckstrin-like domain